jgi:triphosphoribosyl-dephospho-CoA synthase
MTASASNKSNGLPIGTAATLASIYEATAPKPGNVHRGADFEDVTYVDFVTSAVVSGPIVARTMELGIGRTVLKAVKATHAAVKTNTNLGTLLLIVPLAAVSDGQSSAAQIGSVLHELTPEDTRHVYEAIRISAAGGLGRVETADVRDDPPPTLSLVEAMSLAADRDLVARQYGNDFADVFRIGGYIEKSVANGQSLSTTIVRAHVHQLATEADSLILRKCGPHVAEQARLHACRVLEAGEPGNDDYERAVEDLDFWLRSDGHRRNPGTTADLIAAALFVLLREGRLELKQ